MNKIVHIGNYNLPTQQMQNHLPHWSHPIHWYSHSSIALLLSSLLWSIRAFYCWGHVRCILTLKLP